MRPDTLAASLPKGAWQRLSAGPGANTATAVQVMAVGGRGVGSGWRGLGVGGVGASLTN
jgi:hypothetical protein